MATSEYRRPPPVHIAPATAHPHTMPPAPAPATAVTATAAITRPRHCPPDGFISARTSQTVPRRSD